MRRALQFAALTFAGGLLACAGTPRRAPLEQMPERALTYAHPEPDPVYLAMVQDSFTSNGLDRVIVKAAPEADGTVRVVELLSPDVTPAGKIELARAFGETPWAPATPLQPVFKPEVWTDEIVRESPPPAR